MSSSELVAMLIAAVVVVAVWMPIASRQYIIRPGIARVSSSRIPFVLMSLLAAAVINLAVLLTLAAADVRHAPQYIAMYLLIGLGASTIPVGLLRAMGFDWSDVFERGNRAAHTLFVFVIVAGACAFAGANIGDGPGFEVVLFSAALSQGALLAFLVLHSIAARTMYRVLVDRDRGTAFRFGCLLVSCGLMLGRAVAGDWTSAVQTTIDFARVGWPAAMLLIFDIFLARILTPRELDGGIAFDRLLGVVYVLGACGYLALLGVPK
jgi:predicted small integral membrane protein